MRHVGVSFGEEFGCDWQLGRRRRHLLEQVVRERAVVDQVVVDVDEVERRRASCCRARWIGLLTTCVQRLFDVLTEARPRDLAPRSSGSPGSGSRSAATSTDAAIVSICSFTVARGPCAAASHDASGFASPAVGHGDGVTHVLAEPGDHLLEVPLPLLGVDGAMLARGLDSRARRSLRNGEALR